MRESRLSGSVEGVMSNHDPYSDSPEPVGWIQHHQLYSSVGADIVMESITLKTPSMSEMAWLHHLPSIRCVWEIECQRSIGHGRRAWFDFPRARNRL
jgi:hypothetical protein